MIRGFLSGVFWGTVVSALGLGAVSQLTPLPVARIAADASAVPRAKPAVVAPVPAAPVAEAPVAAPEAVIPEPAPAVVPAEPAKMPVTEAIVPPAGSEFTKPLPDLAPVAPATDVAPAPDTGAATPVALPTTDAATVTDAPAAAPDTGLVAPKPLDAPDLDAPDNSAEAGAVAASGDGTKIALAVPGQVALPQADAAPLAVPDPAPLAKTAAEPDDVLLKPLPQVLPVPPLPAPPLPVPALPAPPLTEPQVPSEPSAQLVPDPVLVPDTDPVADPATKPPATLTPTPGLAGEVDGVTIGRLPRIGDPAPTAEAATPPASSVNPDGSPALVIDGEAEQPPLQKYARPFENPDAKPLFSIILIDTGEADLDRAALAAMPFAVTFALDPMAPSAGVASAIYRSAGQEVIMVATGIPAGATAADLEVTFASNATALPEAVAVIDTEFGAFQGDRPMATQVVPILKAQGRGLISWDRGLNAADQVARREGLASGMVFRKLDGQGENKSAVRRALDRAAFKAAQDGRVIVIGQTLPRTVAALMEWAVEGRAASVALAPVSAVLTTQ